MVNSINNKTLHVIDVFLSTPSDTNAEVTAAIEVLNELNEIWGRFLGISFDVTYYKKLPPGISSDAQNVINNLSKPFYDLYLCIIWNRFGTPTPRALSGTAEEFERAYSQYKKGKNPIEFYMYFKKQLQILGGKKKTQAELVREFKKQVSGKGIKYNPFDSTAIFKSMVRMDLSFFVQKFSDENALEIEEEKQIELEHQGYDASEEFKSQFLNLNAQLYELNEQLRVLDEKQRYLTRKILNKSPNIKKEISNFEKFILTTTIKKTNTLKRIKAARINAYESLSVYLMWKYEADSTYETELNSLFKNFNDYGATLNKILGGIDKIAEAAKIYNKVKFFRKTVINKLTKTIENERLEFESARESNSKLLELINRQIEAISKK
jgi:hypothetical protein